MPTKSSILLGMHTTRINTHDHTDRDKVLHLAGHVHLPFVKEELQCALDNRREKNEEKREKTNETDKEKTEREKTEREKTEREKTETKKTETEKAETEKAEREKTERDKTERDKTERQKKVKASERVRERDERKEQRGIDNTTQHHTTSLREEAVGPASRNLVAVRHREVRPQLLMPQNLRGQILCTSLQHTSV
jgi:DNA mismatch repair ATPase MutL